MARTVLIVDNDAPFRALLQLEGFEVVGEAEGTVRLAVNGDLPGHVLELSFGGGQPPARNGIGTVHHVALAIVDDLGAVLVIALFYTSDISVMNLAAGGAFLVLHRSHLKGLPK